MFSKDLTIFYRNYLKLVCKGFNDLIRHMAVKGYFNSGPRLAIFT